MRKLILAAAILVILIAAATTVAGWTWDEDRPATHAEGSTIIA